MFERILQLLKDRNITQKQLAEGIGVSTGNISDWKVGRVKPSVDVLSRIADFFNVSVDYLLGRTDIPNTAELIDIYKIGVMRWIDDRAFKPEESAVLRDNFVELLFRYKDVINSLANYMYSDGRRLLVSTNSPLEELSLASCDAVRSELRNLICWVAAFPMDFNKHAEPRERDTTALSKALDEMVGVLPDGTELDRLHLGEDERDLLDIWNMLDKSGRRILLGTAEDEKRRVTAERGNTEAV